METQRLYYFEDFAPGRVFRSGRAIRMDRDAIIAFARQFDLNPAHLSEESARTSMLGVFSASGWHTASVTLRLVCETMPIARGGLGAGVENLRWPRPVLADDELRVEVQILATRVSRSRPDAGVVTYKAVTLNQRDEPVQEYSMTVMIPRREVTPPQPAA
jgi:acyl dehydratase